MYYWRPSTLLWLRLAGWLATLPQFKQSAHLLVVQREWFSLVCLQDFLYALLVAEGDESKAPTYWTRALARVHKARACTRYKTTTYLDRFVTGS